jgi:hypothetical protein
MESLGIGVIGCEAIKQARAVPIRSLQCRLNIKPFAGLLTSPARVIVVVMIMIMASGNTMRGCGMSFIVP